ncbi:MAG: hypothetical protein ACRC9V_01980 [Aeromonas sp.]
MNKFYANDDSMAAQGSSENPATTHSTSAGQDAATAKTAETPRGRRLSHTVCRTPKR